jgi:hypothetical protein
MKYFLATFFSIVLITATALPGVALAQEGTEQMLVQNAPTTVAQQQQFYVDVAIDTHGMSINGIQGSVTFTDTTLTFVRAETGNSNITLWVDQPTLRGNTLTFSGIIPGGFNGLINPFDASHKLPGVVTRLVFAGKAQGDASISTSHVSVTDNDGQGTLENLADAAAPFIISTDVSPSVYKSADTVPPTLTASVVQEKELFDGQYVLLFTASDKESGIDHVQLKEGDGAWTTIQSPYLLHDQSRKGILLVRAYDVAGNGANVSIAPLAPSQTSTIAIILLALIALIILYGIHKKTIHRKPPELS